MTDKSSTIDRGAWIHSAVEMRTGCRIGRSTFIDRDVIIGMLGPDKELAARRLIQQGKVENPVGGGAECVIGDYVFIGPRCTLYEGCILADRVELEEGVQVGQSTIVGAGTRLMYRCLVYHHVKIGTACNISGFLCNDTVVEDDVSFFGSTVHRYSTHIKPDPAEYSASTAAPIIRRGAVVSFGAVVVGPVEIGEGAFVPPNAVITRDVPPGGRADG